MQLGCVAPEVRHFEANSMAQPGSQALGSGSQPTSPKTQALQGLQAAKPRHLDLDHPKSGKMAINRLCLDVFGMT